METFSVIVDLRAGNSPVTGEFFSQRASDAEISCFLLSAPEQTVKETMETPVIWNEIALIMMSL